MCVFTPIHTTPLPQKSPTKNSKCSIVEQFESGEGERTPEINTNVNPNLTVRRRQRPTQLCVFTLTICSLKTTAKIVPSP
jgi:hypothetical protein